MWLSQGRRLQTQGRKFHRVGTEKCYCTVVGANNSRTDLLLPLFIKETPKACVSGHIEHNSYLLISVISQYAIFCHVILKDLSFLSLYSEIRFMAKFILSEYIKIIPLYFIAQVLFFIWESHLKEIHQMAASVFVGARPVCNSIFTSWSRPEAFAGKGLAQGPCSNILDYIHSGQFKSSVFANPIMFGRASLMPKHLHVCI